MARRILIAEDEALVAVSLADLLESGGYDVTLAFDGEQALERADAALAGTGGRRYDVLVTDLNMPRMCGEDLIRAVRARDPDLPVVVVTGSPPPGGAAELRCHGGGHGPLTLLLKPVDYPRLLETLRRATALPSAAAAD